MPIALALVAALVYGAADFFGGLAGRRTSITSVLVWSQLLGLLLLAAVLPFIGGHATLRDVAWGSACGIAGALATAALYRGLAIGTMGVVSPLSAVLGAAIPVLYDIAVNGHRPPALAYAGIAAALLAVVCVSASTSTSTSTNSYGDDAGIRADGNGASTATRATAARVLGLPPGIADALVAGVAFGAFFITLAQTNPAAGLIPLLAARVTSVVLLAAGGLLAGGVASIRVARPAWRLVLLGGTLDMSANILYVVAAHATLLAIVAVLTSLYPAATGALAAIVLGERLTRLQWFGVALAFAGVVAITAAR